MKDVLYNLKFDYYFYRKNLHLFRSKPTNKENNTNFRKNKNDLSADEIKNIEKLLLIVSKRYNLDTIIFVCHPDINDQLVELLSENKLTYLKLEEPVNKIWKLKGDGHWNCYGHYYMAQQAANFLNNI